LNSAHTTDSFIKELWEFVESDSFYKGNTTLIITTDHGRGTVPLDTWTGHGKDVNGAGEVWVIAFGKGIKPLGEIKAKEQLYSNQIAASIAELLNVKFDKTKIGAKFKFIAN
jgi:bisphosphoglycerate-independent phosphoglycerate mutase (AlkP superfamily)